MSEYIENLREAIRELHGCESTHAGSSRVAEYFGEQKVWEGDVETFALTGHPEAEEAFAWAFDNGEEPQYVAVLKLPPVKDPSDAVRAAIASGAFY